ncbi:MAG: hypothetical protein NZM04_02395 [Methylacidiphilales bacterium]|nr:hypothetical protein [Candidatus Methylacidiphilales bacterium]
MNNEIYYFIDNILFKYSPWDLKINKDELKYYADELYNILLYRIKSDDYYDPKLLIYLSLTGHEKARKVLLDYIIKDFGHKSIAAYIGLWIIGDSKAMEEIRKYINDDKNYPVIFTLSLLDIVFSHREIDDRNIINDLLWILRNTDDQKIIQMVLDIIVKMPEEKASKILLDESRISPGLNKKHIIIKMGDVKHPDVVRYLKEELLNDISADNTGYILKSLGKIGSLDEYEYLKNKIAQVNEQFRPDLVKAMCDIIYRSRQYIKNQEVDDKEKEKHLLSFNQRLQNYSEELYDYIINYILDEDDKIICMAKTNSPRASNWLLSYIKDRHSYLPIRCSLFQAAALVDNDDLANMIYDNFIKNKKEEYINRIGDVLNLTQSLNIDNLIDLMLFLLRNNELHRYNKVIESLNHIICRVLQSSPVLDMMISEIVNDYNKDYIKRLIFIKLCSVFPSRTHEFTLKIIKERMVNNSSFDDEISFFAVFLDIFTERNNCAVILKEILDSYGERECIKKAIYSALALLNKHHTLLLFFKHLHTIETNPYNKVIEVLKQNDHEIILSAAAYAFKETEDKCKDKIYHFLYRLYEDNLVRYINKMMIKKGSLTLHLANLLDYIYKSNNIDTYF